MADVLNSARFLHQAANAEDAGENADEFAPRAQKESVTVTEETDWDGVWHLEQQVFVKGVPLELTESTRALLLRTARQVAISDEDAQAALQQESSATTLLQETRRRIREGSHRLSGVLDRYYPLRDAGDLEGARKLMEDLLVVEVVPLYREQAEILLEKLAMRGLAPHSRKHRL